MNYWKQVARRNLVANAYMSHLSSDLGSTRVATNAARTCEVRVMSDVEPRTRRVKSGKRMVRRITCK